MDNPLKLFETQKDEGALESKWKSFFEASVPEDTPQPIVNALRTAFYGGPLAGLLLAVNDDGPMDGVMSELADFLRPEMH